MDLRKDEMNNPLKEPRKPDWLKMKLPDAYEYADLKRKLSSNKLHTICESGQCPNIGECWKSGTATFMILGNVCTRSCRFCAVNTGKPTPPDLDEPLRIAKTVSDMQLKHCVLTSVDRDDLSDGGATIWAETVKAIKAYNNITIECLVPDFKGNTAHLDIVIKQKPEIISHNLETVKRLTSQVRTFAKYETSLNIIKYISASGITSKSGIMVGLGETDEEIYDTMDDLISAGCAVFTIGQYLRPNRNNLPVHRYVTPETFKNYKHIALEKGFKVVESGPLVRSSYHAEKHL